MATGNYYVPHQSYWPSLCCLGIVLSLAGFANWLHVDWYGAHVFFIGASILVTSLFFWFREVITEGRQDLFSHQVEHSFKLGMLWFIFSEVCFFGTFFGTLAFIRLYVITSLGGEGAHDPLTHYIEWPNFVANWPLLKNPDNAKFLGAYRGEGPWGLALINTAILLTSSITVTIAHWGLNLGKRKVLIGGLIATVLLGILFLFLQAKEYHEAYTQFNLTLRSGIYGATFFMMTGFHGAHVTLGTFMLLIITIRAMAGHFSPDKQFGFEAAAWYWHFVDVVWLFLFIFVYWL